MHILDKLKKLNKSLIGHAGLKKVVEEALSNYDNKENLLPEEISNYEKIYELVENKFPEAAGIILPAAPVDADEVLNKLLNNKVSNPK
jgi:hypothetical protein